MIRMNHKGTRMDSEDYDTNSAAKRLARWSRM